MPSNREVYADGAEIIEQAKCQPDATDFNCLPHSLPNSLPHSLQLELNKSPHALIKVNSIKSGGLVKTPEKIATLQVSL